MLFGYQGPCRGTAMVWCPQSCRRRLTMANGHLGFPRNLGDPVVSSASSRPGDRVNNSRLRRCTRPPGSPGPKRAVREPAILWGTPSACHDKPSSRPLVFPAPEAGPVRTARDATRVVSRVARNGGTAIGGFRAASIVERSSSATPGEGTAGPGGPAPVCRGRGMDVDHRHRCRAAPPQEAAGASTRWERTITSSRVCRGTRRRTCRAPVRLGHRDRPRGPTPATGRTSPWHGISRRLAGPWRSIAPTSRGMDRGPDRDSGGLLIG